MSLASAIIVAAGAGKRFGQKKQFVYLEGKPVLEWTLEAFEAHAEIGTIVLVLPDEEDRKHYQMRYRKIGDVVRGGEKRQDSVWQGFRLLDKARTKLVVVHDGARPLIRGELIGRVIAAARTRGAAVPVLPVVDTLKEVRAGRVAGTVDRARVCRVQTPQGFLYTVLEQALDAARRDRFYGTDEAMLVERIGLPVGTVAGDPRNIKITTPLDLKIAEALLHA
ncbi:MAG TPA: 2-C-methyl-D-erythritol 4-phosphate cytidylyltransferase [Burkholderiales bacterium]|nr:2-C-methyl-D-erythritol 4-phosphate cytidylyltransferase [Burkholderiales bacterium]